MLWKGLYLFIRIFILHFNCYDLIQDWYIFSIDNATIVIIFLLVYIFLNVNLLRLLEFSLNEIASNSVKYIKKYFRNDVFILRNIPFALLIFILPLINFLLIYTQPIWKFLYLFFIPYLTNLIFLNQNTILILR